jgi:ATP-dependent DNA ligase
VAFDCLYLDGRDVRALPLRERREALEGVVENDHTLIFPAAGWPTTAWRRGTRC